MKTDKPNEGSLFIVMSLPYPWPPATARLLCAGELSGEECHITALSDGRLVLQLIRSARSFTSQPIDANYNHVRPCLLMAKWSGSNLSLEISGHQLLEDQPGVATIKLPSIPEVPKEISINDVNAIAECQIWIQNRQLKFSGNRSPRPNRRNKSTYEQANDLQASIYRLRDLQQGVLAGRSHLLGTLAGELRACVYWVKDSQPDRNYSPLLLRMANLAELPLPVYLVPKTPTPPVLDEAEIRHVPANAPRIHRQFLTDKVFDLQESLRTSVLWLGPAPQRKITALDLIVELAHTMGASHYDEDASEFLEIMRTMRSGEYDQVTIFICRTAEAIISLSEWVLSELKIRNLIS